MSTTQSHTRRIDEFEVVPDEIDGWDVMKRGGDESLSNHPTRDSAVRAVRLLEGFEETDEIDVIVHEDAVHEIEDDRRGVKPAFVGLLALLAAITLLVVAVSLVAALTDFGA